MFASTFACMVSASTVTTGTADVTSPTEGAYKKGIFSIVGNLDISITKTQTETAEYYYVKAEVFADSGRPITSDKSSITFSKDETGTKTTTWTDVFVVWSTTAADDGSHTANARVSYKPLIGGTWTPVALDTNNFIVDNTPPIAAFTHSVSELTVNFDASGSTDTTSGIESYEWDFGDGSTGSGVSSSHTYSAEGTYTVTLRVWDKAGNDGTGTAKATVSVSVPEFPLGVEVATGIGLMVVVVYIWLRKRKTMPTVAKRFTTKTQNLDSC